MHTLGLKLACLVGRMTMTSHMCGKKIIIYLFTPSQNGVFFWDPTSSPKIKTLLTSLKRCKKNNVRQVKGANL